jgi:predicted metal-dependent hydrolase
MADSLALGDYEVAYRNIKYPRLEFKTGKLLLILPNKYKDSEKLRQRHGAWIEDKEHRISEALRESKNRKLVTDRSLEEFKLLSESFFHKYLKGFKITAELKFRKMRSKWASCSSARNITLNTDLRYLPEELIGYVIFHEVVHLKERKHNDRFWKMISRMFGDYSKKEKELFVYWFLVKRYLDS